MSEQRHYRPILALGYQSGDGTIQVTDVLCNNFPDMTNAEMAALSWNLTIWAGDLRRPARAELARKESKE